MNLIDHGADFSPCRQYRYRLWRRWDHGPMLMVIGLNPSTADETTDDPTIRRCIDYAQRWGFAGLRMLNLFAYRATDPREMLKAQDPIGPDNRRIVRSEARFTSKYEEPGAVLAAWGAHGSHRGEGKFVRWNLSDDRVGVACLGLTKGGEPRHPLYLRKDERPIRLVGDGGRLVTMTLPGDAHSDNRANGVGVVGAG